MRQRELVVAQLIDLLSKGKVTLYRAEVAIRVAFDMGQLSRDERDGDEPKSKEIQ